MKILPLKNDNFGATRCGTAGDAATLSAQPCKLAAAEVGPTTSPYTADHPGPVILELDRS